MCAIVRSEEEAVQCRQAVCGALACGGTVRDQCLYSFPTLTTSTALSSMYNGNVADRLVEALNGCTTLVILLDEIHPTLDASTQENAMVRVPPVVSAETTRCLDEGLRLIDAAAAASSVQHVILQSALGASDSSFSMLQTARMGGSEHLSLRRKLEEHLESYSQRGVVTPTAPLRHTILQAAPYARAHCKSPSGAMQMPARRMRLLPRRRSPRPKLWRTARSRRHCTRGQTRSRGE